MQTRLRIATFNLENLDDRPGLEPPLAERIRVMRPQILALDADVLCLQEVHGQSKHAPRGLMALDALLDGTPYAAFHRAVTSGASGGVRDVQNLVILSRFPVRECQQLHNDLIAGIPYRLATAEPPAATELDLQWDRPALYASLDLGGGRILHVINLHLRAPLASYIEGQKESAFAWHTSSGWAEGFFLAALKRSGQACEARLRVDQVLDQDADALIAVCGDFNAEDDETPVRLLSATIGDTGNAALAGRELISVEKVLPLERRFSVVHAGAARMLDHILVSKALMVWFHAADIRNQTIDDELVAYASAHRSPESFHAPVIAEFRLSDIDGPSEAGK